MAPYQRIAYACYLLLPIYVILAFYFLPGYFPKWTLTVAYVLAGVLLAACVLEVALMIRDYRAGYFFPLRNATFFVTCFFFLALPLYGVFLLVSGEEFSPPTLLFIPALIFFGLRNLYYVRIDSVSFRGKVGLAGPVDIPLYEVQVEEERDDLLRISGASTDKEVRLLRAFFFPNHFKEIRKRLC